MRKEKKAELRLLLTELFKISLSGDPQAIIIQVTKIEIWIEEYVNEEIEECMIPFISNIKNTDNVN